MRNVFLIILIAIGHLGFSKKEKQTRNAYVLVWGSTQTETGAGHASIALEDTSGFLYYSHYMEDDGGTINTKIDSLANVIGLDSAKGIQEEAPMLVLKFKVNKREFKRMRKKAVKLVPKDWTLLGLNCADFVKKVLRKTHYDVGYAFLISTPYEFVDDVFDHNKLAVKRGKIKTHKGHAHTFLKKEPRPVRYVILKLLGLRK